MVKKSRAQVRKERKKKEVLASYKASLREGCSNEAAIVVASVECDVCVSTVRNYLKEMGKGAAV